MHYEQTAFHRLNGVQYHHGITSDEIRYFQFITSARQRFSTCSSLLSNGNNEIGNPLSKKLKQWNAQAFHCNWFTLNFSDTCILLDDLAGLNLIALKSHRSRIRKDLRQYHSSQNFILIGYIAKYVIKNVSGANLDSDIDGGNAVEAWASCGEYVSFNN